MNCSAMRRRPAVTERRGGAGTVGLRRTLTLGWQLSPGCFSHRAALQLPSPLLLVWPHPGQFIAVWQVKRPRLLTKDSRARPQPSQRRLWISQRLLSPHRRLLHPLHQPAHLHLALSRSLLLLWGAVCQRFEHLAVAGDQPCVGTQQSAGPGHQGGILGLQRLYLRSSEDFVPQRKVLEGLHSLLLRHGDPEATRVALTGEKPWRKRPRSPPPPAGAPRVQSGSGAAADIAARAVCLAGSFKHPMCCCSISCCTQLGSLGRSSQVCWTGGRRRRWHPGVSGHAHVLSAAPYQAACLKLLLQAWLRQASSKVLL